MKTEARWRLRGGLLGLVLAVAFAVATVDRVAVSPAPAPAEPRPPGPSRAPPVPLPAEIETWTSLPDADALASLDQALDALPDAHIFELFERHTRWSRGDLAHARDVRAYVRDLAEVALEDPWEGPVAGAPQLPGVRFSRYVRPDGRPRRPTTVFGARAGRIFAVFPVDRSDAGHVTIRWSRRSSRAPLLLERHAIQPGSAVSHVWFRPSGRWSPGRYAVRVFSGDDSLEPLAEGRFVVVD
jgi:hypothetical protein